MDDRTLDATTQFQIPAAFAESRGRHHRARLQVRSFGMTDRGLVRSRNEDQFLIADLTKTLNIQQASLPESTARRGEHEGHVFLVADGLGGGPAGKEASALAVKSIEEFLVNTLKWFFHLEGPEEANVIAEFQEALNRADATIFAEATRHPNLYGMGSTLTLAYSVGRDLFVAHAGDSRCYVFRNGDLFQLTNDHTKERALAQQGKVSLSPSARRRLSHVITNLVGGHEPGVEAEVHKTTVQDRDVLLLATDGLSRHVSDHEIAAILDAEAAPQAACEQLVKAALNGGGRDNITVIVARYEA